MVALLVRLKLTLLRNSLRRSTWRLVGLILGLLYALGVVVLAVAGLVALRWTSPSLTADVTVLAFSVMSIGWLAMSLLVFGVDETLDPAKFALLPVRARELLPGLLVAGLVGIPGIATIAVSVGLVLSWARSLTLTAAAVLACLLGVLTCFLLARAATSAFASFLSSRRFRDFAFLALVLGGVGLAVGVNLVTGLAVSAGGQPRQLLSGAALVLGWTPFGWAWSLPADVSRGEWATAGLRLLLALGLVASLWRAWGHFLALRLVEPTDTGGTGAAVRSDTFVQRLYPATPAGAVAERTLRYWKRDPRYLAGAVGLLIAPVVLVLTQLLDPSGDLSVASFAPVLLSLLIGISLAQDLSYDGSALWLHLSAGLSGADDRAGRVMSTATVFGPLMVLLLVLDVALTRQWHQLLPVAALTVGLALIGLGTAAVVGALWQWPAPPPGASPFQRGSSGGLPALLSFAVTTAGTVLLGLPTIGLAVASAWYPWLGLVCLVVGLASGVLVLRLGIRFGGRLLDRRWPEVLQAVSEKAG